MRGKWKRAKKCEQTNKRVENSVNSEKEKEKEREREVEEVRVKHDADVFNHSWYFWAFALSSLYINLCNICTKNEQEINSEVQV